jgi:hypothetical protein
MATTETRAKAAKIKPAAMRRPVCPVTARTPATEATLPKRSMPCMSEPIFWLLTLPARGQRFSISFGQAFRILNPSSPSSYTATPDHIPPVPEHHVLVAVVLGHEAVPRAGAKHAVGPRFMLFDSGVSQYGRLDGGGVQCRLSLGLGLGHVLEFAAFDAFGDSLVPVKVVIDVEILGKRLLDHPLPLTTQCIVPVRSIELAIRSW